MNTHSFRINEFAVMLYRVALAFLFYFIARVLFYFYNDDLLNVDSLGQFLKLSGYALVFDSSAIFYMSLLFILMSLLPLKSTTKPRYQRILFWVYFIPNLVAYATNFIDLIYYRFVLSRTTVTVFDSLEHEENKWILLSNFALKYWLVFLLFVVCASLWVYLYSKVKVKQPVGEPSKIRYYGFSALVFSFSVMAVIAGIRGGITKKTRPINMVDANRYTNKPEHGDLILNTPFSVLRTLGKTSYKEVSYMDADTVQHYLKDVKHYTHNASQAPNIVLFIMESFGREYIGAFNEDSNIPNYTSYTPFLDSLSRHSLIFPNAYANGNKSIHGVSSIIAGIPSFKEAFTSSPFPNQKIESLVSTLNKKGYDTSFFHGAVNGSMGFLGFGNILGYDHYYGMTEYNQDEDFDGTWGIWDEPFFQFMKETLNTKEGPFFATMFSVSSHEPFVIPKEYEGRFPEGNQLIHKTIGYSDYALKRFFEESRNEPWFDNTLFIITADHTNQMDYDYYKEVVNRNAVPILFYTPDNRLKGIDNRLAQQIDIYPTVLDYIGYEKPFRSWGSSLLSNTKETPFVINYGAHEYTYQEGNYIVRFDGAKVTGIYDIKDKGLSSNLMHQKTKAMHEIEMRCKAFLQNYFDRIINRRLLE